MNSLEKGLRKRIFEKIESCKENPLHFFLRLKSRADYKLRIGDYRVIADIDVPNDRIVVALIGHRKNIYDKR